MPVEVLTCKSCSQKLRVPRDKGRLKVKCPKCESNFFWGGLDIPTTEIFDTAKNEELQPLVEYILKASTTEKLSSCENYKKTSQTMKDILEILWVKSVCSEEIRLQT